MEANLNFTSMPYAIHCVKNPQANAILERIHAVLMNMLRTSEMNMADSVKPSDIDVFLTDAAWAIRSTYHAVLKASPGAAIFGRDMLFDIPFIADWKKIGEHRLPAVKPKGQILERCPSLSSLLCCIQFCICQVNRFVLDDAA